MKRFLLIFFLIIPTLAALVIGVGYRRGKSCPAYIGNAYYQLKPSVDIDSIEPLLLQITGDYGGDYKLWDIDSIEPLLLQITGDYGGDYKLWGDSKTLEEGIVAYRRSFRYKVSKNADGYLLYISSLADKNWVAVDAPAFPGRQAFYPLLRDDFLDDLGGVRKVTDWEKTKYGFGLFPIGEKLPELAQGAENQLQQSRGDPRTYGVSRTLRSSQKPS